MWARLFGYKHPSVAPEPAPPKVYTNAEWNAALNRGIKNEI